MPAPLRRLLRPLPAFLSFLHAGPHPDPRCSHPRSAPGRPGDAAPLRLFTTMKQLRPPLYPPPRPAPAALPNWPPRRPPRLSSAIGGLARPDSKSPLFIRYLRRLSLRSGPVRAPSGGTVNQGAPEANQSGRTSAALALCEFRGGPWVHSQHSSPAPLGLDSAPRAAGAAPTYGFVY